MLKKVFQNFKPKYKLKKTSVERIRFRTEEDLLLQSLKRKHYIKEKQKEIKQLLRE